MRRPTRSFILAFTALSAVSLAPSVGAAQIRRGMAVDSNVVVKVWNPSGSLKLMAWDRDSLHVEGTGPKWAPFFFGGVRGGVKFGIEEEKTKGELPRVALVVYVPRASRVSAKTVDATIEVEGVSGFYTTVSGDIRVTGALRELQVESLRGASEVEVRAPWVRIMGGEGDATIRGSIEDLAASTVAGRLTVDVTGAARARLETMTGALTSHVAVQPNGSIELDSHAGTVELVLDPNARVDVDATSVAGKIDNQFDKRRPLPGRGGKGMLFAFATDPAGARVVVRTYKGTIIVRKGA
ncbi:MAG: DUF4097 family beta strand repeat-containing protein [Gemmatimonadaceae bacterium]